MKALASAGILFLALVTYRQSLAELEKQAAAQSSQGLLPQKEAQARNDAVLRLIEGDQLTSAEELRRLAAVVYDPYMDFRQARVRYELLLAAIALGDAQAGAQIARAWDVLQLSLGRPQRFGSYLEPFKDGGSEKFRPDPAPNCVLALVKDPAKAREAAAAASDDSELKDIVDEDQKARTSSKMTGEQLLEMSRNDKERAERVRDLVDQGIPRTKQDFAAASLVLQHGDTYASYALAHELSLCALLLGDGQSAWLLAATYDRMLESCGQLQRFGTQYQGGGEGYYLQDVDTGGINDRMRKAMRCPTLEQARTRNG